MNIRKKLIYLFLLFVIMEGNYPNTAAIKPFMKSFCVTFTGFALYDAFNKHINSFLGWSGGLLAGSLFAKKLIKSNKEDLELQRQRVLYEQSLKNKKPATVKLTLFNKSWKWVQQMLKNKK